MCSPLTDTYKEMTYDTLCYQESQRRGFVGRICERQISLPQQRQNKDALDPAFIPEAIPVPVLKGDVGKTWNAFLVIELTNLQIFFSVGFYKICLP